MAGDTIEVGIKDGIVQVDVGNLIFKSSKDKTVLDIQPLILKVSVPAELLTGADGGGESKLRGELQKKLLAKLERELRGIVADVQYRANRELAELAAKVRKELDKDQNDDKEACGRATKLVAEVAGKLERLTNEVPPSLREAIKKSGLFANKSLSSVGTWGFRGKSPGICLRPGVFKHAGKEDRANGELAAALKTAKGGGYEFVLVDNGPGGLVLRKSIGGSATALAKGQAGGRGSALFGEVDYDGDQYLFLLDKSCSESKGRHLAQRIRSIVKERCNKVIKVRVTDEDFADDDSDADAGAPAGSAGARK